MKKSTLSFLCLIFFIQLGQSQVSHEIKFNVLDISGRQFSPSYELIIDSKFAIEITGEFNLRDFVLIDSVLINPTPLSFDATRFRPRLAGKYYTSKKGKGFFIGPYISFQYLLNRDESYADRWEEVIGLAAPESVRATSGRLSSEFGVNFGYKFLIKKHFAIEFFAILASQNSAFESGNSGLEFDLDIKFGYRF